MPTVSQSSFLLQFSFSSFRVFFSCRGSFRRYLSAKMVFLMTSRLR